MNHINYCCSVHDSDYGSYEKWGSPSISYADAKFDSCLARSSSRWTRYVVRPVYTISVKTNSWWKGMKAW
ncbi:unnamed protein product [Caenorhabditis sp. 36 PRJEB53466]|nr:unnamed protein product [Caenorhabditis sp. 36 PRJEB53466]